MPTLALLPLFAAGWLTASGGHGAPSSVLDAAQVAATQVVQATDDRVAVTLYDENHRREGVRTVMIGRDGTVDDATREQLERMLRCKRTNRHRTMDRGMLAMLADVAAQYPGKTIEYVSAFRAVDPPKSNHRHGRAFDFRVRGVSLVEVRDYVWTHHQNLGLGWYPKSNFLHMDHRPGQKDYAWTQLGGTEHGNPYWSVKARRGDAPAPRERTRLPGS